MLLLRIPPAIADRYNIAIEKLTRRGLSNTIRQNKVEYDELCTRLLALEMVCVGGFLKAADKRKYLMKIDMQLERFYQGISAKATSAKATSGTKMNCYPLEQCGNRCCFNSSIDI